MIEKQKLAWNMVSDVLNIKSEYHSANTCDWQTSFSIVAMGYFLKLNTYYNLKNNFIYCSDKNSVLYRKL